MSAYHHGNLREALIENGIQYVSVNGEASLSLRKISAACGVSHAAAYTHFKDKASLVDAMRDHITAQFTAVLGQTARQTDTQMDRVTLLGKRYVEFFSQNPHYFIFLFQRMNETIDLDHLETCSNYEPFEFFKRTAVAVFEKLEMPEEAYLQALLAMWAIVHGLAAIAVMDAVRYSGDWGGLTARILTENILIKGMNHDEQTSK